jgi:hypothetical protein
LSSADPILPVRDGGLPAFSGDLSSPISNGFDSVHRVRDGVSPAFSWMHAANGDLPDRSKLSNLRNYSSLRHDETIPPFMRNGDVAEKSMSSSKPSTISDYSSLRKEELMPPFVQNGNSFENPMSVPSLFQSYGQPSQSYASNHRPCLTKSTSTQTTPRPSVVQNEPSQAPPGSNGRVSFSPDLADDGESAVIQIVIMSCMRSRSKSVLGGASHFHRKSMVFTINASRSLPKSVCKQ